MKKTIYIGDELRHKSTNLRVKVIEIENDPLENKPLTVRLEDENGNPTTLLSVDFVCNNFVTLKELRKQKLKLIRK